MKKHLLQIGKAISKADQKAINGGGVRDNCGSDEDCYDFTTEADDSGCWHEYSCEQSMCVPLEYVCG